METRKIRKIICVLALCIDTTRYNAWKKGREENYLKEARKIIEENKTIDEKGKRFNLNELGIALLIIRRFLGKNWYYKVLKHHNSESISNSEYKKFVKSEQVHPLTKALWSGEPSKYTQVINLGYFLQRLWKNNDSTNLSIKIDDLQRYNFRKTYFELKVAAYFDKKSSM